MSASPPSALEEIRARFDILAMLGEGGMGRVYKVRHRDLDEIRIIKTLRSHLSDNRELRNRFVNEARRGMRLRHPNIAAVHDFTVCRDGTGYIVMEYVDGMNVRDFLAARGPLPLGIAGAIAVQTLDALGYLHGEHFIHRDISPDNLMLAEASDGRLCVKLIDLGISKSLQGGETMTGTGEFIGKVHYASPEQFGGRASAIDGRSDLYSLGVVLYKLLTNVEPFTGDDYKSVISAHLFSRPRTFEEVAPTVSVPAEVQRVIFRALETEPSDRYADAAEFRAAVVEAFALEDVRPAGILPRTAPTQPQPPSDDRPTEPDATLRTGPDADETLRSAIPVTVPATTVVDVPTVIVRPRSRRAWLAAAIVLLLAMGAVAARYLRPPPVAPDAHGRFFALVIGEENYRKMQPLATAAAGARDVKSVLESRYGFHVNLLLDASRYDIVKALEATAKGMTAEDNLLVFYAGHGWIDPVNGTGYWQPVDADPFQTMNAIASYEIADVLHELPARRVLVIADSCYSGAIGLISRGEPSSSFDERIARRSRLVLSSGGLQPVADSGGDGRHSVFTRALLDVLRDSGRPIEAHDLFAKVRNRVLVSAKRRGIEQDPELKGILRSGDEEGTFMFVPR